MTLVGLLNDFLLQKKIGGLSPKTIDSYKNALHVFVLYAGDSLSLKELTQNLVNAYILDLYDRDLSRATVSTYVRSLKIFLRWIHQEYTLCFDPTKIKIPKSPKKIVHIYSDSEIRLIFSVIQNISSIPWINARNAAMVSLMLDSGIRQCEVCGLLRENMDFYGGRMKVLGKGAKERIVPLGKLSQTLLARFCTDNLRASGSSNVYDLSILMGHESIETTKKYEHFAHELIAVEKSRSHLDSIDFNGSIFTY